MIIRPMQAQDLPQVVKLEEICFSMPWKEKDFAEALEKDYYYFLVAEEAGVIIGQAGLIISFEEADITNVAVLPERRKQNIGSKVIEQLLMDGEKLGVRYFTLEVRESNSPAIGLYEKYGFVSEGIRKNFYEKPTENAVIMWKR